jgi:uncharacterized membrane protein YqjE
MTTNDDDPARATVRTAESVVALARAEVRLALLEAQAKAARLLVTVALSAVAAFLVALAVIVLVVSPMLFFPSVGGAAATVATAVTLALVMSLVAMRRWRQHRSISSHEESTPPPALDLRGHDHAAQR